MDINTIKENLKKTIAGKKQAMEVYLEAEKDTAVAGHRIAIKATVGFLEINIAELERILEDLNSVKTACVCGSGCGGCRSCNS